MRKNLALGIKVSEVMGSVARATREETLEIEMNNPKSYVLGGNIMCIS